MSLINDLDAVRAADEEKMMSMENANHDWNLLVGRTDQLRRDNKHVLTAEVDIAATDSTIMWLRSYGNDHRPTWPCPAAPHPARAHHPW